MSTIKRISGVYTIQTVNSTDQVNINSPQVVINGNLVVTGNSQSIVSTDTAITDHTITLNSGVTSPNPAGANIIVARSLNGSSANVSIRWNETVGSWQITNNGSSFANIVTPAGAGITSVSADTNPALGGNLNLSGHSIWDSTTNGTALTLSTPGGAGSGVFATPVSTGTPVELVTQSKALAYSIIVG